MTAQIKYLGLIFYLKMLKLLRVVKEIPCDDCSWTGESATELELLQSLDIKKQWKGITYSRDYRSDVNQIIRDKSSFDREWKRLKIKSPVPRIDFTKKMVIEIVKRNASRELVLKDVYYTGIKLKGETIKKEISYDFYIDSLAESYNIAYLLLVMAKFDLPISFNEKRYYDGFYIAKGYFYAPTECN